MTTQQTISILLREQQRTCSSQVSGAEEFLSVTQPIRRGGLLNRNTRHTGTVSGQNPPRGACGEPGRTMRPLFRPFDKFRAQDRLCERRRLCPPLSKGGQEGFITLCHEVYERTRQTYASPFANCVKTSSVLSAASSSILHNLRVRLAAPSIH